jgi:hypothetical protein
MKYLLELTNDEQCYKEYPVQKVGIKSQYEQCMRPTLTSLQSRIFVSTTRLTHVISKVLYSTDHVKYSRRTRRGTKAGRNFSRPIHTLVNSKQSSYFPYTEHQRSNVCCA